MVSSMTEEQIQTRIDQLAEKPVELLVRGIFDVIWKATTEAKEHDVELEELIIFMLQSMSYCLRSEYLSLPLLSATVRSMALLSDLFDDSTSYLLLYEQMRNIYNSRILQHHPDFGYVIYSILKAVTVLGVEPLESKLSELDFGKHLLGFVEMGLTSHYAVVREHTLHGVLYFLQSMAGESMRPIIQYVSTFLIDEITKQLAITDPVLINSSPSSINYSTVIWATAFRIMEEPVQGNFKQSLNQKLCEALLVANLPHWTLELITAGIETLIFHSTAFSEQFAAVARESFQDYHFHTGKFPYALRIFVDCIFREEADPSRNSAHKFQPLLQTAIGLIHRCYPADALLLAKVFPPILRRLYKDHKALEIILDMLFPDQKIHLPENAHAVFVIIFEFFESLRENQRLASCLQLSSIIVKRLSEILIVESEKTAATSILLTAAHGDSEVASRFHLLLEMYEREPMDWSFYHDWILQKTAEMLVSEGIALCVPLPEPHYYLNYNDDNDNCYNAYYHYDQPHDDDNYQHHNHDKFDYYDDNDDIDYYDDHYHNDFNDDDDDDSNYDNNNDNDNGNDNNDDDDNNYNYDNVYNDSNNNHDSGSN
ncbi:unnamed protein product, partial [Mesorhabditis spiculigera]